MLIKGLYPYEYINSCKGFDKTWLPEKIDFYSNVNMENITDTYHKHVK